MADEVVRGIAVGVEAFTPQRFYAGPVAITVAQGIMTTYVMGHTVPSNTGMSINAPSLSAIAGCPGLTGSITLHAAFLERLGPGDYEFIAISRYGAVSVVRVF